MTKKINNNAKRNFKNADYILGISHVEGLDILYNKFSIKVNKRYDKLFKTNLKLYDHNEICKALKICDVCMDFNQNEKSILCYICDDAYHIFSKSTS